MARYDLTISVYDIEESELASVRNSVLRAVSITTDVSISIDEHTEVIDGLGHVALPGV